MAVAELLAKFPRERTWLLPALQAVQRAERYLSPEALEAVAAHLRVPKSEVWGVASHYPELRLAPPGTRVVRVCTGVSCKLRGGGELLAACERRLGLRAGQTTADGAVTLEAMDCAFACAVAPVVEIDHACHGRVTPRALDALPAARPAAHAAAAAPPARALRSRGPRGHRRRDPPRDVRDAGERARGRAPRAGDRGGACGGPRRARRRLLPDGGEVGGVPRGEGRPEVPRRQR